MHQVTLKIVEPDRKGAFKFSWADYFSEVFYVDGQALVVGVQSVTKVHPDVFSNKKIFDRE